MKIKLYKLFVFFNIIMVSTAQIDSLYETFADHIEIDQGLFEILEQFIEEPIDINYASKEDLEIFPFLSSSQIDSIIDNQPFNNRNDVRRLIGYRTYNLFRSFFTIKHDKSLRITFTHRLKYPFEESVAFKENKYIGSPVDYYNRIKINNRQNFSAGLLSQKDVGEESLTDHFTGYLQWDNKKLGYKVLLGSFQINFGEGIALASPYQFGKSPNAVIPFHYKHTEGRPFLSTMENQGLLGIYTKYSFINNFLFDVYFSKNLRDAFVNNNINKISSLDDSGFHRNESENKNHNVLAEQSFGFICTYSVNELLLGAAINKTSYNPNIYPAHRQHIGNINVYSTSYRKQFKKVVISGEMATNNLSHFAHQHTFFMSEKSWSFGIKWWNIPNEYQSPFGRSFCGDIFMSQGRNGIYIGISGAFNDKFRLNSYCNFQKDLWQTFFNPLPVWEREYLIQTDCKYNVNTNFLLRYQYINSEYYPAEISFHINEVKNKIRVQIDRRISKMIDTRTRIEMIYMAHSYLYASGNGINLYQDICIKFSARFRLQIRFSSFKTSDYKARIYEYENDIPGCYANYPLYGKGNKWYFLLKYSPLKNIALWVKYRKIYFSGVETIGSGNNQIKGDTRQFINLQLNYSY